MDQATRKVRAMYEQFPYPSRSPNELGDFFPHLCMSYREDYRFRPKLTILDAGCGTGGFSLGTALCNPDCRVVAVDINRQALARLRREIESWEISNIEVVETDLHTLEGVTVPSGGFDLISCGGVLHHLTQPLQGLRKLQSVLAEDGVMRLMVYNTLGRQALYRFVNALDLLHPKRGELTERLALGRRLMGAIKEGPIKAMPWNDGESIDDVEFVDRYLNLQDRSYSVQEYFELLEQANLSFLRWYEPGHWNPASYISDPELLERLGSEPAETVYSFVEQLSNQALLDGFVAQKGSALQRAPGDLQGRMIALNPQAMVQVCHQSTAGVVREVGPRVFLRGRHSFSLEPWEFEILKQLNDGPLPADTWKEEPDFEEKLGLLIEKELVFNYLRVLP